MGKNKLLVLIFGVLLIFLWLYTYSNKYSVSNLQDYSPQGAEEIVRQKPVWRKILGNSDSGVFYSELKKIYSENYHKHTVGHIFGELLYEKEGIKGIEVCDGGLFWGCYHSLASLAVANEGEEAVGKLTEVCNRKFGGLDSACHHGIGHGLYEFYGEKNLESALEKCNEVSTAGDSCHTGVFMEMNFPVVPSGDSYIQGVREFEANDSYSVCDDIDGDFRGSCYYELPRWWERVFESDFSKISKLCMGIGDKNFGKRCFEGSGEVISLKTDHDSGKTITLCNHMNSVESKITCLMSAAKGFNTTGDTEYPDLCAYIEKTFGKKCQK
jgi:hypothetical protein